MNTNSKCLQSNSVAHYTNSNMWAEWKMEQCEGKNMMWRNRLISCEWQKMIKMERST